MAMSSPGNDDFEINLERVQTKLSAKGGRKARRKCENKQGTKLRQWTVQKRLESQAAETPM